jgi:adenylate cyclase
MADVTVRDPALRRTVLGGVLQSESRRATLTAAVFALLAALTVIVVFVPGAWPRAQADEIRQLFWPLFTLFGGMLVYEWVLRLRIGRLLVKARLPTWAFRYANVLAEITLPTVVIFMLATVMGPLQAMSSPASLLYPLFVFMAVLYLDMWVCLFAGVLAALEFGGLAFFFLHGQGASGLELVADPQAYFVKAMLLLTSGLVAGFVTIDLRRQMLDAVASAEQRDHAISIFGQHVSPEIARQLLAQRREVEGEEQEACVMFLDIRDFSHIAADKTPPELMRYLNTLFVDLIEAVNANHGIVHKFLGDGFMAVFGAPVEDAERCQHAVDAALDCLKRVDALNASGAIAPTRVGIGLHAGKLVTGNVGASQRKEYTLIGETVNVASRLEQATKFHQAQLLVSEEVWLCLKKKPETGVYLGPIVLKGQKRPVQVYQLA